MRSYHVQLNQRGGEIQSPPSLRIFWFAVVVGTVLLLFFLRLVELQIIRGVEFRSRSDENRFFTRTLPASRGIFFDRYGVALVRNSSIYKKATEETKNTLYPIFESIDEQQAKHLLQTDEKNVFFDQKREYIFGPVLASLMGYIGETTREDLAGHPEYSMGEYVGRMGLERTLQSRLAGSSGKEVFEMDASGKLIRTVSKQEAVAGLDVALTIDASLSAKAYALLADRQGVVVATDIKTGEVLMLVSSPSYDPEHIQEALKDKRGLLFNRAISGTYPPGSTFKIITALAGLQNGVLNEQTRVLDTGELRIGDARFGNWYFLQHDRTEGEVSLIKALQRSNDIYFYKAAEWTGPDHIAEVARLFHYDRSTGVELGGEASGVIPDPAWKGKSRGEKWFLGDTYHMGIGQGDVLVTPLQVNQMTAALANNGVWCQPHLLKDASPSCIDLGIDPQHLALILEGMEAACSPGGTAFPFFDHQPVPVACKTGTAEFGGQDEKGRRKTHGWFTMLAPVDQPRIAITVLVEGNDDAQFLEGSKDAAPIAKELLKEWVKK